MEVEEAGIKDGSFETSCESYHMLNVSAKIAHRGSHSFPSYM